MNLQFNSSPTQKADSINTKSHVFDKVASDLNKTIPGFAMNQTIEEYLKLQKNMKYGSVGKLNA